MKVYFTTSVRNLNLIRENVDYIFKTIENQGHNIDRFNYSKDPELGEKTDTELVNAFKHVTTSIRNSDFIIAELTEPSAAVGYEIAYALGEKKPVLILINESKQKQLSTPFRGNKSKYLSVKKYRDNPDIEKAVKLFLADVKNLIDTKFILIIPPTIDKYLEWNSKERGIAKAEVTREAIEKMMELDTRYQDYLKNNTSE